MGTREIYQTSLKHFLAPIRELLEDESVSEIMVNGPFNIYYERAGRISKTDARFADEASLMAAAQNIAEFVDRRLDATHHSMDARLPDGSRVHAIIPPSSRQGICLSIRKFQTSTFDLDRLVQRNSLTGHAAEFLRMCVLLHKNIVVSGGTGTGKTSFLNALSAAIDDHERIIVIEDSSELRLHQPHTLYLEAQPGSPDGKPGVSIRDLFVDSLRMRPDRIIVGEVRRGEALDLIQSMLSGHSGSITTVHASTPRDAATRLETLCLLADAGLPVHVARSQVASAVDVVVQLVRMGDGSRRVSAISECLGLDESGNYLWRDLYSYHGQGRDEHGGHRGVLKTCGVKPTFAGEPVAMGFDDRLVLTTDLFQTETSDHLSQSQIAREPTNAIHN